MSGPLTLPALPAAPLIDAAFSAKLAFYAAAGMSVLAPRGWHCIEIYGSGGAFLLVTPRPYTAHTLPGFNSLEGPAIELSFWNGENSGRDQVAEVFSRLFPAKHRFVRDVQEADPTHDHGSSSPYLTDTTVRRSRTEVDFTTPSHRQGMGTFNSRLGPGMTPIIGRAILAQSNGVDSVVLLRLRLPPGSRALVPTILDATSKWWRPESGLNPYSQH